MKSINITQHAKRYILVVGYVSLKVLKKNIKYDVFQYLFSFK